MPQEEGVGGLPSLRARGPGLEEKQPCQAGPAPGSGERRRACGWEQAPHERVCTARGVGRDGETAGASSPGMRESAQPGERGHGEREASHGCGRRTPERPGGHSGVPVLVAPGSSRLASAPWACCHPPWRLLWGERKHGTDRSHAGLAAATHWRECRAARVCKRTPRD